MGPSVCLHQPHLLQYQPHLLHYQPHLLCLHQTPLLQSPSHHKNFLLLWCFLFYSLISGFHLICRIHNVWHGAGLLHIQINALLFKQGFYSEWDQNWIYGKVQFIRWVRKFIFAELPPILETHVIKNVGVSLYCLRQVYIGSLYKSSHDNVHVTPRGIGYPG